MRIAIDIDSTLHHYWDLFEEVVPAPFRRQIRYADQVVWEIDRLKPEQVHAAVRETHSDRQILAAEPYPGAVEVDAPLARGRALHPDQLPPRRRAHDATAVWLERIGLPYDELYCSFDKVARCEEIGIDLLIDDSPDNLQRAIDAGIAVAT